MTTTTLPTNARRISDRTASITAAVTMILHELDTARATADAYDAEGQPDAADWWTERAEEMRSRLTALAISGDAAAATDFTPTAAEASA